MLWQRRETNGPHSGLASIVATDVQLEAEVQLESWQRAEVREGYVGVHCSARIGAGGQGGRAG